jgi:hypothetical protein
MRIANRPHHERGLTLVDVLVGLMVLAIGSSGIFAGFRGSLHAWTIAQQRVGEQHNARLVLDWMARRLRMAGYGYAGSTPSIAVADAHEVVFYANTNGGATVECHHIYLSPTGVVFVNVTQLPADCRTGTGDPLTTNLEVQALSVTGMTFKYFDGGAGPGTELTSLPLSPLDRSRVKQVQITLQVSGLGSLSPLVLSEDVFIRN